MPHVYGIDPSDPVLARAERVAAVAGKNAAEVDKTGSFPAEAVAALAAEGLYGLCVPEAQGGLGKGPRQFVTIVEELAAACASTAMIYVMHVSAAQAIVASETLAGKGALLGEIAAGKHLTTLAFSERGSRSQFWAPVSRLSARAEGGFTTQALKSWVTSANHAHSYVSSALAPAASGPVDSALYLVRRGAPGVRAAARFDGMGLRGNDSVPVTIEGLVVAKGDLLTPPGAGLKGMLEVVLPWFAVGTAAMANGLCRASVGATGGHLAGAGFEHTGEKLRDLPTLRARLAEMSVRTEQSRALLGYTVGEMESPSAMTPLYVLQSRLAALEAAVDVTDLAMKACGGAAFSRQLGVERMFRDARAGWVMAPTADHLREFVGRALSGLPVM